MELLGRAGLPLEKKADFRAARRRVRFKELPEEEKARLAAENPAYGRVICRCETVTEGEIVQDRAGSWLLARETKGGKAHV